MFDFGTARVEYMKKVFVAGSVIRTVVYLLEQEKKILAIRLVKGTYDMGLRESKDVVDAIRDGQGVYTTDKEGYVLVYF